MCAKSRQRGEKSWIVACRLERGGGGLGAGEWCFGIGRLSDVSSKAWSATGIGTLGREEARREKRCMASSNFKDYY